MKAQKIKCLCCGGNGLYKVILDDKWELIECEDCYGKGFAITFLQEWGNYPILGEIEVDDIYYARHGSNADWLTTEGYRIVGDIPYQLKFGGAFLSWDTNNKPYDLQLADAIEAGLRTEPKKDEYSTP